MYAIIGLDNEAIINACKQVEQGEVVSAVNFNSPGQVVIAGAKEAVERAAALCKRSGRKTCFTIGGKCSFTLRINETGSRTISSNT